jgi:hypothetical protein
MKQPYAILSWVAMNRADPSYAAHTETEYKNNIVLMLGTGLTIGQHVVLILSVHINNI